MTISPVTINNSIAQDRATAKAIRFVNADDNTVYRLARRNYNIEHGAEDRKSAKKLNVLFKSIPALAVASGLLSGRGVKTSLKHGASWGLALAVPAVVYGADSIASSKSDKKNHAAMNFGLSILGFFAANDLLNKAAKSEKVNKVFDNVIAKSAEKIQTVKKNIKVPENALNKFGALKEAVKGKVPEAAKNIVNSAKNSKILNNVASKALSIGKGIVRNAPDVALAVGIVAICAKAVSVSNKISKNKAEIKEAQFNTAKELANRFGEENLALKS